MRYGFGTLEFTSSFLTPCARSMRKAPTRSERLLWQELRGSQLGVRFRRQVVLGRFIVDFFAPAVSLAVEVDGGVHAGRREYDVARDRVLAVHGVHTLRVPAWLVEKDVAIAVVRVRAALSPRR